jgi:hypothetical protein
VSTSQYDEHLTPYSRNVIQIILSVVLVQCVNQCPSYQVRSMIFTSFARRSEFTIHDINPSSGTFGSGYGFFILRTTGDCDRILKCT